MYTKNAISFYWDHVLYLIISKCFISSHLIMALFGPKHNLTSNKTINNIYFVNDDLYVTSICVTTGHIS